MDKLCTRCQEVKSVENFYIVRAREKFSSWCKDCHRTQSQSNPSARLWNGCRRRARHSGLLFTITKEDILVPRNCPVCTCKMVMGIDKEKNIGTRNSPSVDRYNPQFGYVPGNVWVICCRCNMRKQDMSGEDHIVFGQRLVAARQKSMAVT
jgi:hypothetical protein